MSFIELKNVCKEYANTNKKAVTDFNLKIDEKEFIAFVGPSGCGKSTLLNIIGSLENKTNGEIIFNKKTPRIGYMFQNDCLFPWLNVLDNCLIGLKIKKELTKEKKEEVISLLKNYGLKDFIYSYPTNLSGGMKQRVVCMW